MSSAIKNLVEKFNEEGIPTGKVATMFSGDDQQFSNRDCWNHLRNLRKKNLDVGDAQAVLSFSYQYFGDVITFDTSYKTNKYAMPFAPFTELNHHCQSILFRCALLQDESEQSFIWLFETWLKAMYEKRPISIIIDQDKKVFPTTRHCLCLWHIKKKFPEKLAHIYHKNSTFKHELKKCIRESTTVNQFEEDWRDLIVRYGLEKNEWLETLHSIRESWIPAYKMNTFFARMNTIQRSKSINAFFYSFIDAKTSLQEFVIKYDKAVDSDCDKEIKEDFE
ncbi:protein FAR1-RELATED SEQUENCE 5-like [Hevea brasiliensis]|uniref:protein FAR1-RELATED SEQUENCE 5-like n=1 Tax=Hevea brasiliensis TaxID=3981 RepID=UPI0025D81F50|nr:protein FAR1-RELATED SEQUENCE 5-like [Hevea brasiliensis]